MKLCVDFFILFSLAVTDLDMEYADSKFIKFEKKIVPLYAQRYLNIRCWNSYIDVQNSPAYSTAGLEFL